MRELASGLWVAEMPFGRLGLQVGARMTVLRLPDGGLWLHSPIAMTADIREALAGAGPVTDVVAPSALHCAHLRDAARAYPRARLWAPAALRSRFPDMPLQPPLGETAPTEWQGALALRQFRGSRLYDEFDFHHAATRTLVLTDLLFRIPDAARGLTRQVGKWMGIYGSISASRTFAWSIRDQEAAASSLRHLDTWDFDRMIFAHGTFAEREGKAAFRRAFATYLSPTGGGA